MVLPSTVLNARAWVQPALLPFPQVVPAHPDGNGKGSSTVKKV